MPFIADLKDMVIAINTTTSNAIGGFDDAEAFVIYSPAQVTGNITVQVAPDREVTEGGSASQTWATMQSGGVDITLTAGKALTLTDVAFRQLRLVSDVSEAAGRTFKITKQAYPISRGR